METGTDDLLVSVRDGVATVTLNRPDRRNALSAAMLTALAEVVPALAEDGAVGAILLTGAGGAFCAGGDVKGFHEQGGEGGPGEQVDQLAVARQLANQRAIISGLYEHPKPVVAALPGAAAGAGLGLALAADLRIGCERTVLATGFVRVGLSGDYGTTWLLHRLVGRAVAGELMLLGDRVDADRALRLGLVNRLVGADELAGAAFELTRRLADGPRPALEHIRANLRQAEHAGLDESMTAEVPRHKDCGVSGDHREAIAAFVGKREPAYRHDA